MGSLVVAEGGRSSELESQPVADLAVAVREGRGRRCEWSARRVGTSGGGSCSRSRRWMRRPRLLALLSFLCALPLIALVVTYRHRDSLGLQLSSSPGPASLDLAPLSPSLPSLQPTPPPKTLNMAAKDAVGPSSFAPRRSHGLAELPLPQNPPSPRASVSSSSPRVTARIALAPRPSLRSRARTSTCTSSICRRTAPTGRPTSATRLGSAPSPRSSSAASTSAATRTSRPCTSRASSRSSSPERRLARTRTPGLRPFPSLVARRTALSLANANKAAVPHLCPGERLRARARAKAESEGAGYGRAAGRARSSGPWPKRGRRVARARPRDLCLCVGSAAAHLGSRSGCSALESERASEGARDRAALRRCGCARSSQLCPCTFS